MSAIETWGFSLTGHIGWIGTATTIHAALGAKAIFVWLPGVIVSVLLVLQVQRLGSHWSDMAGGTHKVASRLLQNSILGRYVAIAYFIGWASTKGSLRNCVDRLNYSKSSTIGDCLSRNS